MRRNIAKVSALIMAATTTMSPMMPAATTVAWAEGNVVALEATTGELQNVAAQWDKIDWTADVTTVEIVYKFSGSELEHTITAPVTFEANPEHGKGNLAVATVTGDEVLGTREFTYPVPEDSKYYKVTPHVYDKTVTEWGKYDSDGNWYFTGVEPSCTEGAVKRTKNVCSKHPNEVDADSVKYETVGAQGHSWGDWEVVEGSLQNIELDEAGNMQLVDKSKDGYYLEKRVCKFSDKTETRTQVIPTNASTTELVANAKNNTVKDGDKIVLIDHTKSGKYTVEYYSMKWNEKTQQYEKTLVSSEEKTMEAGHTWGNFVVDLDYKYDGKNTVESLKKAGKITVKTDEKTGDEYVVNNDCSKEITVRYVQKCTDPYNNEKTDAINEATAKVVTVEPTGRHNYSEKKGESVASEDGKTHITSVYKECTECGDRVELESTTVDHYDKNGKIAVKTKTRNENVVEATCGEEGSYDVVTYCADCGYEFSTEHFTVPATGDHKEWDAPELELVGNYVIYYEDKGVEVNVHQHCVECGEERLQDKDGHTTLTVNAVTPKVTYAVENTVDGKKVKLEVKTSKVEASKYECTPDTIKVEAVYYVDGKQVLKEEKVVPYFFDKLEYNTHKDHVAGTPVTEKREDGTYKVTYCKYGCGTEMSAEKVEVEKTLGQVEGLKATAKADGQVEVSWDALEGADGYLVVAINGKVRGQQIGYTAGTSFVDKDANAKDYNYYWVIPYFKNADGKIVKGQLTGYVYAMKQTEFAAVAESTEDGVALTWEAVEGASKYIVKAKAASEKTATAIATVEGTEYVDATASADEYTFYLSLIHI